MESENAKKFFVFANGVIWKRFKKNTEEFRQFCKFIGQECFGTLFMPDDREGSCKKTVSAIIQLYYPGVIRYADIDGKKISAAFIEGVVNLRKVRVNRAIVIASAEKDFVDFDCQDKKLSFVILDEKREVGKYVCNYVTYSVIHSLMDAVTILESEEAV